MDLDWWTLSKWLNTRRNGNLYLHSSLVNSTSISRSNYPISPMSSPVENSTNCNCLLIFPWDQHEQKTNPWQKQIRTNMLRNLSEKLGGKFPLTLFGFFVVRKFLNMEQAQKKVNNCSKKKRATMLRWNGRWFLQLCPGLNASIV